VKKGEKAADNKERKQKKVVDPIEQSFWDERC